MVWPFRITNFIGDLNYVGTINSNARLSIHDAAVNLKWQK